MVRAFGIASARVVGILESTGVTGSTGAATCCSTLWNVGSGQGRGIACSGIRGFQG